MDAVITPAYLLRAYAWAVLKRNDAETWDESKYDGKTPIIPVAEAPEFTEAHSGPYIVYGYSLSPTGDLYARQQGSMTFAVYDQNFRRLTKTLNILAAAFERQDEAAADINKFTSTIDGFIGMRFGYVRLGFVEGGTPETEEGGRQSALLNINFEYYVDYDVVTDVAQ